MGLKSCGKLELQVAAMQAAVGAAAAVTAGSLLGLGYIVLYGPHAQGKRRSGAGAAAGARRAGARPTAPPCERGGTAVQAAHENY